jgi:hypothetical protein
LLTTGSVMQKLDVAKIKKDVFHVVEKTT